MALPSLTHRLPLTPRGSRLRGPAPPHTPSRASRALPAPAAAAPARRGTVTPAPSSSPRRATSQPRQSRACLDHSVAGAHRRETGSSARAWTARAASRAGMAGPRGGEGPRGESEPPQIHAERCETSGAQRRQRGGHCRAHEPAQGQCHCRDLPVPWSATAVATSTSLSTPPLHCPALPSRTRHVGGALLSSSGTASCVCVCVVHPRARRCGPVSESSNPAQYPSRLIQPSIRVV